MIRAAILAVGGGAIFLAITAYVPCNSLSVSVAGVRLIDLDGGRTPDCPVKP